jgi:glycosyltransferase involved in cell wall biosynthesis
MVLVDTLSLGGAEKLAVQLAAALDPASFRPHVVVTKRGGPLEEQLHATGVPHTILHRRGWASPGWAGKALALARESDLVHSHLFGNNVWGALLARVAGIPLVAHEHNRVSLHSRLEPWLDRRLLGPTAHRIVCVTDDVADALVRAGVDPRVVEVVPNGVPAVEHLTRGAARSALGLPADAPVVGAVASLRPEKALDVLLRAFARLEPGDQTAAPQLCVVGDGSERTALRELARALGIADRVVWAGQRPEAARLLRAFDVAVICSRSEGMPLAALEAMAAGTPLVATRVGALPGLLREADGVLVDVGDDRALAQTISRLLARPADARAIGRRGQELVAARYGLDSVATRIEGIYRDALGREAPEGGEPGRPRFSGGQMRKRDLSMGDERARG